MENTFKIRQDTDSMIDVVRSCLIDHTMYQGSDDAFFVMDMGYQVRMVDQWTEQLPNVYPFYAVKVNPDPGLLRILAQMNFGFDCASLHEIQTILDLNVSPSRIVYAQTHKQPSHLKYASSVGVDLTVFDDENELHKIKKLAPNMRLLLRLSTKDFAESLAGPMTDKFGCVSEDTARLLEVAKQLDLNVVGVSFHVGRLGVRPTSTCGYIRAIKEASRIFSEGRAMGFQFDILDIGGGFPAEYTDGNSSTVSFNEVAQDVSTTLQKEFSDYENVQLIAEPGSYFAMSSTVLVANIIGKRQKNTSENNQPSKENQAEFDYFINDGIFSSFMKWIVVPNDKPVVKPVAVEYSHVPNHTSRIWGQTCCGKDVVLLNCELPEMNEGDWLYFTDQGSYAAALSSTFNGFQKPSVYRFISPSMRDRLKELIAANPFQKNNTK